MSDDPFDPTHEAAGAPGPDEGAGDDRRRERWAQREERREEHRRRREELRQRREERRRARKGHVLHTRISEQLSDDIREAAEELRVPVSNLVRNVLEEAFGAVERVSEEVGDLLDEVLGEAEGIREDLRQRRARRARRERSRDAMEDAAEPAPASAASPPAEATRAAPGAVGAGAHMAFPDVLGWQSLLVNGSRSCACGERTLAPGDEAFVGVTERGLSGSLLCAPCMRARRQPR